MVEQAASPQELTLRLTALRDGLCENPATRPDSEVTASAGWAWGQLLKGEIYHGRDSGLRINRLAQDSLRGEPGGSVAAALFVRMTDLQDRRTRRRQRGRSGDCRRGRHRGWGAIVTCHPIKAHNDVQAF